MASASLRGRLVGHKLQSRPLVRKPLEIKSVFHLFLLRLFWTTLLIESLGSFDVSKHGHSSVLVTVHSLNFFCPQWLTPHPQGNSVLFPQPLILNGPVDTGPEILNPDVSSSDCRALMWQVVYLLSSHVFPLGLDFTSSMEAAGSSFPLEASLALHLLERSKEHDGGRRVVFLGPWESLPVCRRLQSSLGSPARETKPNRSGIEDATAEATTSSRPQMARSHDWRRKPNSDRNKT